ncbi:MAG: MucR family transcriptional regulator [Syntrophobacteraceae bacterium]
MPTILEMSAQIVSGQSSQRILSGEEIQSLLVDTYRALKELERLETSGGIPESKSTGVQPLASNMHQPETAETAIARRIDPAESIREAEIVCLECMKTFRQLTHTHLKGHGLSPDQYKRKYGISMKQPLAAAAVSDRRKSAAREQEVGEFLKWERAARAAERADQSSNIQEAGTKEGKE